MRADELLFGEIAVTLGLLTRAQLKQAFSLQAKGNGDKLDQICLAQGWLSQQDADRVRQQRRAIMSKRRGAGGERPAERGRQVSAGEREPSARPSPGRSRRPQRPAEIEVAPPVQHDEPAVDLAEGPAVQLQQRPASAAPPPHRPAERTEPPPGFEPVEPAARQHHPAPDPARVAEIERLLRRMVEIDASDLHLSAGQVPLARVHGALRPLETAGPLDRRELHAMLMAIAGDETRAEFERSRDADFAYAIEGVARFRANYFVDRRGICAVFRQIPFEILSAEQLGLPRPVIELCWRSKGLVLVTGPTGSGKSTTLATLIDFINRSREDHIITIEDPIEFVHDSKRCLVNQREVGTHTSSFKSALRAALREDPDVVLVGELRDLETVEIALETAETGHLVFGTLHTTTAPATIDRIIDQFPANQQAQIRTMLAETLKGVVAQMLCRKQGGGRVAAYEVLMVTPAVSNIIREGKTHQLVTVMQTQKAHGMQTLNDHLLELVRGGRVSGKEALLKSHDPQSLRQELQRAGIDVPLPRG